MRKLSIFISACIGGLFCIVGCTQQTDSMVARHMGNLESDLRVRGTLEKASIERQFESFRKQKHAEIDAAHDGALAALEGLSKLNRESARKASDRFTAMHHELDTMVNQAKAAALQQATWYDLAADTVRGEQQYQQAKSQALVEGGKAFLEAFGASYVTAHGETSDTNESKAQGLMQQITGQLKDLLSARLATTPTQ